MRRRPHVGDAWIAPLPYDLVSPPSEDVVLRLGLCSRIQAEQAVAVATETPYGLAAYVRSGSGGAEIAAARLVAGRLRAGNVTLNEAGCGTFFAPFGGDRQSGNGRENGRFCLKMYLEAKPVICWGG